VRLDEEDHVPDARDRIRCCVEDIVDGRIVDGGVLQNLSSLIRGHAAQGIDGNTISRRLLEGQAVSTRILATRDGHPAVFLGLHGTAAGRNTSREAVIQGGDCNGHPDGSGRSSAAADTCQRPDIGLKIGRIVAIIIPVRRNQVGLHGPAAQPFVQ